MMLPALDHRPNPQNNRIDQLKVRYRFCIIKASILNTIFRKIDIFTLIVFSGYLSLNNVFQDQLDFASRDIQEERRERLRMREQLSIQNEIINKLYTRLNQVC